MPFGQLVRTNQVLGTSKKWFSLMPFGNAFVAFNTLMLLLAVSDCRTDFRMRFALYHSAVETCRDCGISAMRRLRLFWAFMIWIVMSSRAASDRSALGVSALL